jgi:hypothetical protein
MPRGKYPRRNKATGDMSVGYAPPKPPTAKELLEKAAGELRWLQRTNMIMSAKLEMFEAMRSMLPNNSRGHGVEALSRDIAYDIEQHLKKGE